MQKVLAVIAVISLSALACGDTPVEPESPGTATAEIQPSTPDPGVPEPDESREDVSVDVERRSPIACSPGATACVNGKELFCVPIKDQSNLGRWESTGQGCLDNLCVYSSDSPFCQREEKRKALDDKTEEDPFGVNDETTTNPGPDSPDSNGGTSGGGTSGGSTSTGTSSGSSGPSANTSGETQPGAGGGGSSVGHGL